MAYNRRSCTQQDVAITTSAATTGEISIGDFVQGEIFIPTGSSITTLTYYVAPNSSGTYIAAQDGSGAITQTVAAAKAYQMPSALFGAAMIRIVGNAAGTVTINIKN